MAQANTYKWESGGYCFGECDIPNCKNPPKYRRFFYPTYMNGDAETEATLCEVHKSYKQFGTTKKIIEAFNRSLKIKPNQYQCEHCKGVFDKGWSDEDAKKEAEDNFGKHPDEWNDDQVIICDDCYKLLNPMKNKQAVFEAKLRI